MHWMNSRHWMNCRHPRYGRHWMNCRHRKICRHGRNCRHWRNGRFRRNFRHWRFCRHWRKCRSGRIVCITRTQIHSRDARQCPHFQREITKETGKQTGSPSGHNADPGIHFGGNSFSGAIILMLSLVPI